MTIDIGIPPVDEKLTTPYEGTYIYNQRNKSFNECMEEVSNRNGTSYIGIFNQLNSQVYINSLVDGLHPNSEGYQMMYEIIRKKLIEQQILK